MRYGRAKSDRNRPRVCYINFDDERFWKKKSHTYDIIPNRKELISISNPKWKAHFLKHVCNFWSYPSPSKKKKRNTRSAMVLRRRSTTSAKNAMPEEKRAKENQSEDVPLHRLIESTLRARWFLTAFFFFRLFLARGGEEAGVRTFSLLPSLPSLFFAPSLLFETLNYFSRHRAVRVEVLLEVIVRW